MNAPTAQHGECQGDPQSLIRYATEDATAVRRSFMLLSRREISYRQTFALTCVCCNIPTKASFSRQIPVLNVPSLKCFQRLQKEMIR